MLESWIGLYRKMLILRDLARGSKQPLEVIAARNKSVLFNSLFNSFVINNPRL
jgi:hypothetical protein